MKADPNRPKLQAIEDLNLDDEPKKIEPTMVMPESEEEKKKALEDLLC